MQPSTGKPRATGRRPNALRRYGPFVVIVVVIAVIAVVALVSGGGDDNKSSTKVSSGGETTTNPDLPLMFTSANKDKVDDWGPNCDTKTGRMKIPYTYASPCVEPFKGSDNGGATSTGVTEDSIKVVVYLNDPRLNPLQAALVRSAGADVDLATARETYRGWFDMYQQHYETYGRKVDLQFYLGTGGPQDEVAARNDARAIADMKPFAVVDGPAQTPVFGDEITARGIECIGSCALAVPQDFVEQRAPYFWSVGPLPDQASELTVDMIDSLFARRKAEFAGDASLRRKTRVFGAVHYDTADGQQTKAYAALRDGLRKRGIKLAADIPFLLDVARGQENARTMIAKLKSAGVTSVIFYGDPLTPGFLTKEATAQDYHPEWIIGPNVYVDTAVFGRTYDQDQWRHAFGLSLTPARGEQDAQQGYALYKWQYGKPPPNNTYNVMLPQVTPLFTGIQLAGPKLTPQTFRDGLFRYPVTGGDALSPTTSRGRHGLWPGTDWGGTDDAALIWWNPKVKGQDEIGNDGTGLYEYVKMGKRYRLNEWPKTDPGLFDASSSVTIFERLPAGSAPPRYPSPAAKR